jgi:DNA repair exonuclease SbcCD ATPase subunit
MSTMTPKETPPAASDRERDDWIARNTKRLKDEMKTQATPAASESSQCCGPTWGAFIDGKCSMCGRPLPPHEEWPADPAAELARLKAQNEELRKALEAITRRVPIMGSTGEYERGQIHALESCSFVARAALANTGPTT